MNDQNDIQTIREIFYRMINDKDLTASIEETIRTTGCTLADARRIVYKSFEGITLDGIQNTAETA